MPFLIKGTAVSRFSSLKLLFSFLTVFYLVTFTLRYPVSAYSAFTLCYPVSAYFTFIFATHINAQANRIPIST